MAITLESSTSTEEELREAFTFHGAEPPPKKGEEPKSEPAAQETKTASEKPGEPGAKTAAEPEVKTEAGKTEPAKTSTQEVAPPAVEPVKVEPPKKDKGGYQRQIEKKTALISSLQEQLNQERGDRTSLQSQLDEAKAQLAAAKGTGTEVKDDTPVKPKRPTLAGCEFDNDKYETALVKYDEDLDVYHAAMRDKAVQDGLNSYEERRQQEAKAQAEVERVNSFVGRKDAGKANFEDWAELEDQMPKNVDTFFDHSDAALGYVMNKSKDPAILIHFFMDDYVNGGGVESERIGAMDAYDQIIELKAIEDRITSERKAAKAGKADPVTEPPAKAEPAKTEPAKTEPAKKEPVAAAPPAKTETKTQRTPEPPIEPLSGRGHAEIGNLDEQIRAASDRGDGKEFTRLRNLQKVQQARAAGRVPA